MKKENKESNHSGLDRCRGAGSIPGLVWLQLQHRSVPGPGTSICCGGSHKSKKKKKVYTRYTHIKKKISKHNIKDSHQMTWEASKRRRKQAKKKTTNKTSK